MKKILAALLLSTALAACSLAPDYQRPNVTAGNVWLSKESQADTVDANWWHEFGSSELDGLVNDAVKNNVDLAAGVERIEQARAQAKIAGASLFPQISADGGYNVTDSKNGPTEHGWNVGGSVSYELDLFGANRNAREAALFGVNEAEFNQAALALVVASDAAQDYAQMLTLKDRVRLTQKNLDIFKDTLKIVQSRFDIGTASGLELAQQKATLANAQASLESLNQNLGIAQTALAILLGKAPQDYSPVFQTTLTQLTIPNIAPVQPSDLLARRPDVRAEEESLKAANANIGVARAELFPSVSLGASAGLAANPVSAVPVWTTEAAASIAQKIFSGGALTGQVQLSEARKRELIDTYRGTVLNAFKETQDALITVTATEKREKALDEALTQSQQAYSIAKDRYMNGADDFLSLLDAQRSLLDAEDAQVEARLDRLNAAIALFKALGGGWKS